MKKLAILGLPVLALLGLSACNPDTDPKIDTSTDFEFKLNTPQLASQSINLAAGGMLEFSVSQPNYGLTVAPTYGLQVSLKPDFVPVKDEPVVDSEGEEHEVPGFVALNLESQIKGILEVKASEVASAINQLNGIFEEDAYTEDYVGPLYVRATAWLGSGTAAIATATVSNVIVLSEVQGYPAFEATELLLSVPGNANGWTHLPQVLYVGDDEDGNMVFKGFAVIDGGFKISDGDWDNSGNWGSDDTGLIANDDGTFSAPLFQNAGDFNTDGSVEAGMYYVEVIITKDMFTNSQDGTNVGTVTITPITSISLPGVYNEWDTAGNEMTQEGNLYTWTANTAVTDAGWKFAMNGAWAINLGGDIENLTFDGSDITLGGSTVTLQLEQYPWTCTVE